MKKYHFAFFLDLNINSTVGCNIEAESIEIALKIFREKYPYAEISYIHNKSI